MFIASFWYFAEKMKEAILYDTSQIFFKQANYLIFLEILMHLNNEQVTNILSITTNIIFNEFALKVLLQTIRDIENQQCIMYMHIQCTHIVCVHEYGNKMPLLSE